VLNLKREALVQELMNLKFYGGINEIGGNKIIIEDENHALLFDFGMSFSIAHKYFSEFLQPRKCNGILDFLEFGLLPNINGLYRKDYLEHVGIKYPENPVVDAVFITHAHADHSSFIHHLRGDIPIHTTEATRRILEALDVTSSTGFTEFIWLKETFSLREKKDGSGYRRLQGEAAKRERDIRVIDGKTIKIGDFQIEAVPVNHSLPGATAYIVYTPQGNIVYTGDFRFHGYGGKLTREFIRKAKEAQPKILICEGTRINEFLDKSEEDVKREVSWIISRTKGLVIVDFPIRDIDRMNTFYEAAKNSDRKLVINLRQAYLLKLFEKTNVDAPSIDDPNVRIYIPRKNWGTITCKEKYPENIIEQDYEHWEREFLYHKNAITCKDIRDNPQEYVFRCDFFELKNLIDVKPKDGSVYIRSVCEPFDEEMEIDLKKVENWLEHFNLLPYYQIHASGHAPGDEIMSSILDINPEKVFPIHTEHPRLFHKLLHHKVDVVLPELEKKYEV
jgi:ribonuclease J